MIQRLAQMLGRSLISWLRMLIASVNSLFFVSTSAHGIESLDLTNRIWISFSLWRYLPPPSHSPISAYWHITHAALRSWWLVCCTSMFLPSSLTPRITNLHTKTKHRLLGWSTFTGFIVLLAEWPLNSFIMKQSIWIQKGVLVARDKWMGVLNELIGAVRPSHSVFVL